MKKHLTPEEFSSLLMGDTNDLNVVMHIKECDSCRSEVASFHSAVTDYRHAVDTWMEDQAAIRTPLAEGRPQQFSMWSLGVPLVLSSIIACVVGAAWAFQKVFVHHTSSPSRMSAARAVELEQDNQWLFAMYSELQIVPESLTMYPSETASLRRHRPHRQRAVSH